MRLRVVEWFDAKLDDGTYQAVRPAKILDTDDKQKAQSWIRQGLVIKI